MSFLSRTQKSHSGNAMIIALVTISITALAVVGVAGLVSDSEKSSRLAYESSAAGAANDSILEVAQYDAAFHTPGHEVQDAGASSIYSKLGFAAGRGQAQWTLSDRSIFLDPTATKETAGYDGSEYAEYPQFLVFPRPTRGTNTTNTNWNVLTPGVDETVPLFVDNTSCAQNGVTCN